MDSLKARKAAYYQANKTRLAAQAAAYHRANFDKIMNRKLLNLYGITLAERDALIEKQGGGCAVCGDSFSDTSRPHVDHNHETGEVRGVLCDPCNRGLGFFDDSLEGLMKAVRYLGG